MTTRDFKPKHRITLQHPTWLGVAYGGLHVLALLCVVVAHMPLLFKLLLILVLVLSALHVRVFLTSMFRVKYICLEDKQISVVYEDQTLPMSIAASPIVMDWLVLLTLHHPEHGGVIKRWVDAFASAFRLSPSRSPKSITLLVFARSCSEEEHSALRRFLLTYSYNPSREA